MLTFVRVQLMTVKGKMKPTRLLIVSCHIECGIWVYSVPESREHVTETSYDPRITDFRPGFSFYQAEENYAHACI